MKKMMLLLFSFFAFSCGNKQIEKVECYAWFSHNETVSEQELKNSFNDLKQKGIDALLYSAGHDPETYRFAGKLAKEAGLDFHAWIPSLVQQPGNNLMPEWYAVNRLGESAYDKPAYVDYYKFLCPKREEVYQFLENLYLSIVELPEVDGVHLDYIRYPDVILARGLWEKYHLVMDKEYPQFDYCYCDSCVFDFKQKTTIDIRTIEDPSTIEEWKQYRYNLISKLVNRLVTVIHKKNKRITAAVFPGPNSVAKKIVRQEWDKWDIDAFFPMNYNDFYLEGTSWIGTMCKESREALGDARPFYSGLFICPVNDKSEWKADPEGHGLIAEELEEAVRESMENGASGICLFTPDRMTEAHWKSFQKAIYKKYK